MKQTGSRYTLCLHCNVLTAGDSNSHRNTGDIAKADRTWTFCGQSMDVPRAQHVHSVDTAQTFCGLLRANSPTRNLSIYEVTYDMYHT